MPEGDYDKNDDPEGLERQAYDAFDAGRLREAARYFLALTRRVPDYAAYHYMQGLAHKYLREWRASLECNLRSIALRPGENDDPASHWNAGIAATALGDWDEARRHWQSCGIPLPGESGRMDGDFGQACIRLNPWSNGETLHARRIDPVRARLLNVPFPESGFRYGDVVLHDGASTGRRRYGDTEVLVFNAMERLEPSPFKTYTAFITCSGPNAADALTESQMPGIGYIEDWTDSVVNLCLRCSYGAPHVQGHHHDREGWNPERTVGIAAQSEASAKAVLRAWKGVGRRVDDLQLREFPLSGPREDQVWWVEPDDRAE